MGQPIPENMANAAPPSVNDDDDDEWEYEYDPNETEDFYFTLDLTSHAPNALVQKPATTLGSHEKSASARRSPSAGDDDGEEGPPSEKDTAPPPAGRLQIVDLHTTNPLVKFDDEVFDCHWSTDLGTQVHIAQAGDISNPRRAGTVLDIVGTSQTRLVGKPVVLQPRDDVESPEPQEEQPLAGHAMDIRDESESDPSRQSTPQAGEALRIPRALCETRDSRAQASFLERLSAIKLKKGETDNIPIHGIRTYELPKNVNEIRQRDIDAETARLKKAKDDELAAKAERPRKRRRKYTSLIFDDPVSHDGTQRTRIVAGSLGLGERPAANNSDGAVSVSASSPAAASSATAQPAPESMPTPAEENVPPPEPPGSPPNREEYATIGAENG